MEHDPEDDSEKKYLRVSNVHLLRALDQLNTRLNEHVVDDNERIDQVLRLLQDIDRKVAIRFAEDDMVEKMNAKIDSKRSDSWKLYVAMITGFFGSALGIAKLIF